MIKEFKTKPVQIEAAELTPNTAADIWGWMDSNNWKGFDITSEIQPDYGWYIDPETGLFYIRTLEGDMKVSLGDFVIKGLRGEFYPCKPDVFHAKYEEVS